MCVFCCYMLKKIIKVPNFFVTHNYPPQTRRKQWSSLVYYEAYLPNFQSTLVFALRVLSLLFWHFINTTDYHLGRYKPSPPSTKEFHASTFFEGNLASPTKKINIVGSKKWAIPGLFFIYFQSFSYKLYNFYNKSMWKYVMSMQYPAPGFEPTTLGMWVSSHNH